MKISALLLFIVVAMPVYSYAQYDERHHKRQEHVVVPMGGEERSNLSIFSENGEQFFLVLNGIAQNNVPTSRIRVQDLPQFANDVEIIFADRRTPAIRKRIIVADPVAGRAVDLTVKILSGMEQYPVLRFHKCTEVEHNYRPQHDECVMSYGKPGQTNTVTTTTTTTYNNTPPPPTPMDQRTFEEAKRSISNASFEDTKLSTAKTILNGNYVTTNQVMEICKLFSFENTMLTFAEYAYSRTLDANNYFRVGEVFTFDSNKTALNDFISKGGR